MYAWFTPKHSEGVVRYQNRGSVAHPTVSGKLLLFRFPDRPDEALTRAKTSTFDPAHSKFLVWRVAAERKDQSRF